MNKYSARLIHEKVNLKGKIEFCQMSITVIISKISSTEIGVAMITSDGVKFGYLLMNENESEKSDMVGSSIKAGIDILKQCECSILEKEIIKGGIREMLLIVKDPKTRLANQQYYNTIKTIGGKIWLQHPVKEMCPIVARVA